MKTINITRRLSLFATFLAIAVSMIAAPEAEYRKLAKSFTLNADGSQEYRYNMELTLFTHTAMNGTYGESFIIYNPACQELKIHESYTRQKDGTIVRTPDNAFVEVLPKNAADAAAYNHLKEMVVVHTGLELGATIYLDYSIITKAGALPEVDFFEKLCQTSPVKDYTLTVNIPEGKTLQYTLSGSHAKPRVSSKEGMKTLQWQWKNLPAASREQLTNVNNGDIPCLAATTYKTSQDAMAVIKSQLAADDDPQLSIVAEGIIEGIDSEEEQLKAILKYVSSGIDYSAVPVAWTQNKFRNTDEVMNSAYGTEVEKVNLLSGLLNAAGFAAEPVAQYDFHATQGLALNAVSRYLVYCKVGNDEYLLTPFGTGRPAVDAAHPESLVRIGNGQPLAIQWPEDYAIKAETTIQFKEGQPVAITRQKAGSLLLAYFVSNEKTSTAPATWVEAGNYATLKLNDAYEGITYKGYGKLNSHREMKLLLNHPVDESYDYTIDCPEGYSLKTAEGTKTICNKVGTLTRSIAVEGGKVKVHRTLKIDNPQINPSDYNYFRALMTEWDDYNNCTLVFGK